MGAMKIEFLWFEDCPNHEEALRLLQEVMAENGIEQEVISVDLSDPDLANQYRFPGSPTIRIDGRDIEPGFAEPGDYTPRCRLYLTPGRLVGIPERSWIDAALQNASLSQAEESPVGPEQL
jgi:hypothetical protein